MKINLFTEIRVCMDMQTNKLHGEKNIILCKSSLHSQPTSSLMLTPAAINVDNFLILDCPI